MPRSAAKKQPPRSANILTVKPDDRGYRGSGASGLSGFLALAGWAAAKVKRPWLRVGGGPKATWRSARRLSRVHPVSGSLRFACGSEDRPRVVLQHFEPGCHIGCVVRTGTMRQAQIG